LINVARSGGYQLENAHDRLNEKVEIWSERYLGAWWAVRLGVAVVVGLFVALQGIPGAALTVFITLVSMFAFSLLG
jgi:hypothetical protein